MHTIPGTWTLEFELNGNVVRDRADRRPPDVQSLLQPRAGADHDHDGSAVARSGRLDRVQGRRIARARRPGLGHRALPVRLEGQRPDGAHGDERGEGGRLPHHVASEGRLRLVRGDGLRRRAERGDGQRIRDRAGPGLEPSHGLARDGWRYHPHSRPRSGLRRTLRMRPWARSPDRARESRSRRASSSALVVDSWTLSMVDFPNSPPYSASIGALDAQGIARTHLTVPGGLPPSWAAPWPGMHRSPSGRPGSPRTRSC